jgi:hypothetical protein
MTEQQQNIVALFNTKDAANIEIAETIAISTGLGRWFNRYINKLIAKIGIILERNNITTNVYTDYYSEITERKADKYFRRIVASALAFFVFNLHKVRDLADNFSWCSYVVFDSKEQFLQTNFDYDWYDTITELKSVGCRFNKI